MPGDDPNKDPKDDPKKDGGGAPDPAAELARLRAENEALKAAAAKKDKKEDDDQDDDDLRDRARREREKSEKAKGREKQLESSLRFTMGTKDFLKNNESLLPKEASEIFAQADKENFGDAIEKDQAIKSGLMSSFFAVQANVDLLTAGQKAQLDDWLKLTKNGKQEKAQAMYDLVFEPALDKARSVKRAEALSKGHGTGGDDAYKNRLMSGSKKHYLGDKANVT